MFDILIGRTALHELEELMYVLDECKTCTYLLPIEFCGVCISYEIDKLLHKFLCAAYTHHVL